MASKTTRSSKARENQLSWRAQATSTTVGPWTGQLTRGAAETSSLVTNPTSMCRQVRLPPPWSNHGATTPQAPAAASRPGLRSQRHDKLGSDTLVALAQLPPADHHRSTQPEQLPEYARDAHAFLLLRFPASTAR